MLDSLYLRLADLSPAALIIIPLAIMFFCAFGMTRITKRLRLPSVTAYLTAGILIGPCCLSDRKDRFPGRPGSLLHRLQRRGVLQARNPA